MLRLCAAILFVSLVAPIADASQDPFPNGLKVTAASINAAAPNGANDKDPSLVAKAEILLDRAHFSPGAIDGLDGDNVHAAIRVFQKVNGLTVTRKLDAAKDSAP